MGAPVCFKRIIILGRLCAAPGFLALDSDSYIYVSEGWLHSSHFYAYGMGANGVRAGDSRTTLDTFGVHSVNGQRGELHRVGSHSFLCESRINAESVICDRSSGVNARSKACF
jgi:hypothetical protein